MICGWCGLPINEGDEHGIQRDREPNDPPNIALNMVCHVQMLYDTPKVVAVWNGVVTEEKKGRYDFENAPQDNGYDV